MTYTDLEYIDTNYVKDKTTVKVTKMVTLSWRGTHTDARRGRAHRRARDDTTRDVTAREHTHTAAARYTWRITTSDGKDYGLRNPYSVPFFGVG